MVRHRFSACHNPKCNILKHINKLCYGTRIAYYILVALAAIPVQTHRGAMAKKGKAMEYVPRKAVRAYFPSPHAVEGCQRRIELFFPTLAPGLERGTVSANSLLYSIPASEPKAFERVERFIRLAKQFGATVWELR